MSSSAIAAKIEEIENGLTPIITDPPVRYKYIWLCCDSFFFGFSEFDTNDKTDQFMMLISDDENEKVGIRSP